MFCVVQEVQLKKANRYGACKNLRAVAEYYPKYNTYKYSYSYDGGQFERPIHTAYKISIHESKRVNGKVVKKQYVIETVGYYTFCEYPFYTGYFDDAKIAYIAHMLNSTKEEVLAAIEPKLTPLSARIQSEFKQTEEYKTKEYHTNVIEKYYDSKEAFAQTHGCEQDIYDCIFDVFGNLKNQALYSQVTCKPPKDKKALLRDFLETLRSSHRCGEINGDNMAAIERIWQSLIKRKDFNDAGRYTNAERAVLKSVYRKLAKAYHGDVTHDDEPMKFVNELKHYWGL